MSTVQSFPPRSDPDALVLVLGTMPGKESLRAGQYYAHARNLFWPIVSEVLGLAPALDYPGRIAAVVAEGVAIWDVLQHCSRESSLDSDIADEVPNDFPGFFKDHPNIVRVCFNGAKAEALYRKHVLPTLDRSRSLKYVSLPSTSPANASITRASKLASWSAIRP